jgi:hypothetical protein
MGNQAHHVAVVNGVYVEKIDYKCKDVLFAALGHPDDRMHRPTSRYAKTHFTHAPVAGRFPPPREVEAAANGNVVASGNVDGAIAASMDNFFYGKAPPEPKRWCRCPGKEQRPYGA